MSNWPHIIWQTLLTTAFLLFGLAQTGLSQTMPNGWEHANWTVFNQNEDTLRNAWAGGLTAPQWSTIDADLDGDDDLFVFDRHGLRLLMFERTPKMLPHLGDCAGTGQKAGPNWSIGACCGITIATANPTFSPASRTASASTPTPPRLVPAPPLTLRLSRCLQRLTFSGLNPATCL